MFASRCRKIRLIETNAKCCHPKKLTCKGTLRQVFIRVYRLEIANFLRTFSHVRTFNTSFVICTLPWYPSSLLSGSTLPPTPLPCVNKCTMCTRIQCVRGEEGVVWGSGSQTDKHLRQSPFTGKFFKLTNFSLSIIFLRIKELKQSKRPLLKRHRESIHSERYRY